MHLAIVTPLPPSATGIGHYGFYISSALSRSERFNHITILTGKIPGYPGREERSGLTVERIWTPGHWDVGPKIIARLESLKPDVVWYNLGVSVFGRSLASNVSGLIGPIISQQTNLPSVITLHELPVQADLQALQAPGGPLASLGARMVTYAATRGDVVCVTLRRQAEWLHKHSPELNLQHIPHGSFFPPCQLGETSETELLIFGAFAPFKGIEVLLKAFQQLQIKIPSLHLTVAGMEHPRFPGYISRVQSEYGHIAQVRWLGQIPEGQVEDVFRKSNIVVLPYIATTGSSSVIYRAATWGRPMVASDLPELRAAAEEVGLLVNYFPTGSAGDLSDKLFELLIDPTQRDMQVKHNLIAIDRLSLENTCAEYLRAFDLALAIRQERVRHIKKERKAKYANHQESASGETIA
jgi:glycosyltransferase involved in cell wall biosynthesis